MAPSLSFESAFVRRLIILVYWAVALIAACVWWSTTSITRLSLPERRIAAQLSHTLCLPLSIGFDDSKTQEYLDSFHKTLKERLASYSEACVDVEVSDAKTQGQPNYLLSEGSGHLEVRERTLVYPSTSSQEDLTSVITKLIMPSKDDAHNQIVVKQMPTYRLAFSLLNEDAAAGDGVTDWDIEDLVKTFIHPITSKLAPLHNFTVESQVRYHAPLAFSPQALSGGTKGAHGLSPSDLSIFVNSAEWSLASGVSEDPVLHFIAFVPSTEHRPLYILDSSGNPVASTSFTLPQWGGIALLNPEDDRTKNSDQLASVFATFSAQLRSLMGIPYLPLEVLNGFPEQDISDWQFDNVLRRRIWESTRGTKDTLASIVKLVHQLENMPIGQDVQDDVRGALRSLHELFKSAQSREQLEGMITHATRANVLSSRAFFNPNMLALLYFPMEHIYAVYTPLFVPVSIPLLAALIREVMRWRAGRKAPQLQGPGGNP